MAELIVHRRFEGCLTVPEIESMLGTQYSFESYLKTNKVRHLRRHGNIRLIPYRVFDRFLSIRTKGSVQLEPKKPRGWLTGAQAGEKAGVDVSLFWQLARLKSDVRAVYVPRVKTLYYHPDDVERIRLTYNETPLPGWVHVTTVNARGGASSKNALSNHLARKRHEVRWYRHPETKRLNRYCREEVAWAWLKRREGKR